ncbi:hypothetical protein F4779DRAFT_575120 [Xylariaceae sp. FL0662B]|nr:hypothetical protein F4779DRAFT_575120 [Xylariaceae sp. FL0662B]
MLFKIILLAATTFGLSNAACTFTGYSNADCTGNKGKEREVTSAGDCIELGGRQSFLLSSDCHLVTVVTHTGSGCSGPIPSDNDLTAGCQSIGSELSAFVQLR